MGCVLITFKSSILHPNVKFIQKLNHSYKLKIFRVKFVIMSKLPLSRMSNMKFVSHEKNFWNVPLCVVGKLAIVSRLIPALNHCTAFDGFGSSKNESTSYVHEMPVYLVLKQVGANALKLVWNQCFFHHENFLMSVVIPKIMLIRH